MLLVISGGQPYSYSFPQSPHSQLPTFHPPLGLSTFCMVYLMVANIYYFARITVHFPFLPCYSCKPCRELRFASCRRDGCHAYKTFDLNL